MVERTNGHRKRDGVLRRVPRTARLQPLYHRLHTLALTGMNLDFGGRFESSGEETTLAYVARHPHFADQTPVVFDVGANVGLYTQGAIAMLGERMELHAFEPSAEAFGLLTENVGDCPQVHLHHAALGDTTGEAALFSDRPGSDMSSLFVGGFDHWALDVQPRETTKVTRLDTICDELSIEHISLLKLDVEGGELAALKGAGALLDVQAIDLVQFEFGIAAMGPRVLFRDLYNILNPHYRIHRIVEDGLVPHDDYDPKRCEIFTAGNYLAVSREFDLPLRVSRLPRPRRFTRN